MDLRWATPLESGDVRTFFCSVVLDELLGSNLLLDKLPEVTLLLRALHEVEGARNVFERLNTLFFLLDRPGGYLHMVPVD